MMSRTVYGLGDFLAMEAEEAFLEQAQRDAEQEADHYFKGQP
jgi:hypothetical protein